MIGRANASFATDQSDIIRSVNEMACDYSSFTSCNPQQDVWSGQAGDDIAGYARGWYWAQADGLHLYG